MLKNEEQEEEEMISERFWLYDIEYDNNEMLEGVGCYYLNRFAYIVLIAYTVTYALVWQKNNTITNSQLIIIYTLFVSIALMAAFWVWLMIRFSQYNKILKRPRENKILHEEIPPIEKQSRKSFSFRAEAIESGLTAVQVMGQSGEYSIETKIWAFICLTTIFGHTIILLTMIIRFPFYGTSWIVFGINMFNMITCHIFTTLLSANIFYNLLADICFYQECIDEGKLQVIMMRLYAETGFNAILQMGLSVVWGSMASAFIVGDVLSIALLIIFLTFMILYFIYTIYEKNFN